MMRGQALRYTGWMIADRHLGRLAACIILCGAIMLPIYLGTRDQAIPVARAGELLSQLHTQFVFMFALLFGGGLISMDRQQGHFRFYLAKPVSPLWFYGQHVVLAFIGLLLASAALITLFALIIAPAWEYSLVWRALTMDLLIVMPIVLFSTLSRHDWLWAIVLWLVCVILRGQYPASESALGKVLNVLLPPYQLMNKPDVTAGEWAWMSAWALGFFAATMLMLWQRPLAED